MKPFRLQSVLDFRKKRVELAQKTLAVCLEEKKILDERVEMRQKELKSLCGELDETKRNEIVLSELMLFEDCIDYKKEQLQDTRRKLQEVCIQIERRRKELFKARQESKALEIIKENREELEKKNQARKESMFLDEIATFGYGEKNDIA